MWENTQELQNKFLKLNLKDKVPLKKQAMISQEDQLEYPLKPKVRGLSVEHFALRMQGDIQRGPC